MAKPGKAVGREGTGGTGTVSSAKLETLNSWGAG